MSIIGTATGLEGEYEGTGKNPDGKQYKVKILVEPAGNLYRIMMSLLKFAVENVVYNGYQVREVGLSNP